MNTFITDSMPCCKSELDLFYTYTTNTSILSSSYVSHSPSQSFRPDQGSFQISLPPTNEYTDLNDIFLVTEVSPKKITSDRSKNDALDWTDPTKIGSVNNFAHSLFKRIDIEIFAGNKDVLVENYTVNYAYKAYLLNLLNFSNESHDGWLSNGLFVKDSPGEFNNFKIFNKEEFNTNTQSIKLEIENNKVKSEITKYNFGYNARRQEICEGNGTIRLIIPIHCDFLKSNKLLMDEIGMRITFIRNEDNFCLIGEDQGKIEINKIEVHARKCEITEEIKVAHRNALKISPIKYPIKSTKLYVFSIDEKSYGNTQKFQIGEIIPNKVIFGLIGDDAYNGSLKENPFNFESYDLRSVSLRVNSKIHEITVNRFKNDFIDGFHSICEVLNLYNRNKSPININEYNKGNNLFGFNLNPDKGCTGQFKYVKRGSIEL